MSNVIVSSASSPREEKLKRFKREIVMLRRYEAMLGPNEA